MHETRVFVVHSIDLTCWTNNEQANEKLIMSLVPFGVIPGCLNTKYNKNCVDWHYNLLAFGSEHYVVIFDVGSSSRLQTLDGHAAAIVKIKW